MGHFRGTVEGSRGEASRLGGKESGLATNCNGWNLGCKALIQYDKETDRDYLMIWVNGGSNDVSNTKLLGKFWNNDGKLEKYE